MQSARSGVNAVLCISRVSYESCIRKFIVLLKTARFLSRSFSGSALCSVSLLIVLRVNVHYLKEYSFILAFLLTTLEWNNNLKDVFLINA